MLVYILRTGEHEFRGDVIEESSLSWGIEHTLSYWLYKQETSIHSTKNITVVLLLEETQKFEGDRAHA